MPSAVLPRATAGGTSFETQERKAIEAFNTPIRFFGQVADNAPQITDVTDTDLAAIGLPVAKTPTRATTPPSVCENMRLFNGPLAGEITGRCDPVDGFIRVYEGQWALDPDGTNGDGWHEPQTFPNSRAFKFGGL